MAARAPAKDRKPLKGSPLGVATLKVVNGFSTAPDGTFRSGRVRAVLSTGATITSNQEVVPTTVSTQIKPDGTWTLSVYSNSDLTPAQTYYTFTEVYDDGTSFTYTVVVPGTAGPFNVAAIMSGVPGQAVFGGHVSTLLVDGQATFTAGPIQIGVGGSIDTVAAGALNIGNVNANPVNIGRAGVPVSVLGNFSVVGSLGSLIVEATGNNVDLTRPGTNYITATAVGGGLNLGAGGRLNDVQINASTGDVTLANAMRVAAAGDAFLADGKHIFFAGANGIQSYNVGLRGPEPTRVLEVNARMAGADMQFRVYDGQWLFLGGSSESTIASLAVSSGAFRAAAFDALSGQLSVGRTVATSVGIGSGANYASITGGGTGTYPVISASGSDAIVGLYLSTKGSGGIFLTDTTRVTAGNMILSTGSFQVAAGQGLDTSVAGKLNIGKNVATSVVVGQGNASSRDTLVLTSDAPRLYFGVVGASLSTFKISAQDTIGNALQFFSGTQNADPTLSAYTERMRLSSAGALLLTQDQNVDVLAAGALNIGAVTATTVVVGGAGVTAGTAFQINTPSAAPWHLIFRRQDLGTSGDVKVFNGGGFLSINGKDVMGSGGTYPLATTQYVQSRGQNLVSNGSGLLFNNYNFSSFTFDQVETFSGGGSFRINAATASFFSDELIPIDPSQTYFMSLWAKSGDVSGANYFAANQQYIGVSTYDIDGQLINPMNYAKVAGSTDTTLAATLNPGDTTMTLANATGWANGSNLGLASFAWYGYTNAKGYTYPNYTYTRNVSDNYSSNGTLGTWTTAPVGNVITLRVPWAGPSIPSGTAVRNRSVGGTYKYIVLANASIPNAWTFYSADIGGLDVAGAQNTNQFPYGTAYVKLVFLVNYQGSANNNVRYSDVSFAQLPGELKVKTAAADASLTLSANPGQNKIIWLQSTVAGTGSSRWSIYADSAAEAGANAGSNFVISRYDDGANYLGDVLRFNRASAAATIVGATTFSASATIQGGAINFNTVEGGLQFNTTPLIRLNATGLGFFNAAPVAKPTVTGAKGANAALASLLTALVNLGLIIDSSTA